MWTNRKTKKEDNAKFLATVLSKVEKQATLCAVCAHAHVDRVSIRLRAAAPRVDHDGVEIDLKGLFRLLDYLVAINLLVH